MEMMHVTRKCSQLLVNSYKAAYLSPDIVRLKPMFYAFCSAIVFYNYAQRIFIMNI